MYEALMSLLMPPRVTIRHDPGTVPSTVVIEVAAPGFRPGYSTINLHATVTMAYRMSERERAIAITNGFTNVAAMERFEPAGDEQPMKVLEWSPLYAENGMTQIGIRQRYALPPATGEGRYRFEIRARARHITPDHLVIPTIPGDEKPREPDPVHIDPDVPGWIYARQTITK